MELSANLRIIFFITIYYNFHNGHCSNSRKKRDDASFANNFGGPVVAATFEESGSETMGSGFVSVATSPPAPPPSEPYTVSSPIKKCQWIAKTRHVLSIISYNGNTYGRSRKLFKNKRDVSYASSGVPAASSPETGVVPAAGAGPALSTVPPAPSFPAPANTAGPAASQLPAPKSAEKFGVGNYILVISTICLTPEACFERCKDLQCNYILRSSVNGFSYLYRVNNARLVEANYSLSPTYDSYAQVCPQGLAETFQKCIRLVSDEEATKEFDSYRQKFNKTYDSFEEFQKKAQVVRDNLQIIKQLNCERKGENEASFGINEYSDLSYEEFIKESGGSLFGLGEDYLKADLAARGKLIQSKCPRFDWNELGVIPPVRKQGKCGACFAFSTSDLIAAQYHIDRRVSQTFTLAPQYFVDCMKTPASLGCSGGRPIEVLRNLTQCSDQFCNIPREDCYPYQGKQGQCQKNNCQLSPNIDIFWSSINDATGADEMDKVAAILNWGPAVVLIDANQAWQHYTGQGILRSTQCTEKQNHAVLLTGYDYTGPIPYYIIKNSWGPGWGDKGYIKLEAGKNTCGVAKSLTVCCTHNCDPFKTTKNFPERVNSEKCI